MSMRFNVVIKLGNRNSRAFSVTLRELCINLVDRFSLTNSELTTIVKLELLMTFKNKDLEITRTA